MRALGLLIGFCLLAGAASGGERLSGSNVDVRTTVTFKVSDAAVQKLLPEGWELSSPTSGPAAGFNLAVVLIDSVSGSDAEGKPVAPFRGGVVVIPVRKKGTDAAMSMVVFGIAIPEVTPGSYGVYMPGKAAIERKVRIEAAAKSTAEETWEFRADDGHAITLQIAYERGPTAKAKLEANVYSGAKPAFYRIYRFEQVADVALSKPTGINRVSKVSFKASGPKLAPMFDGTEQVISVTSIPSYSRTVFLPD
jgi:hypothetical protein